MVPHMDEPQSQFPAVTVSELIKPELARGNGPTPPQKVHAMSNYNNSGAETFGIRYPCPEPLRKRGPLRDFKTRIKLFLSKLLLEAGPAGPNVVTSV